MKLTRLIQQLQYQLDQNGDMIVKVEHDFTDIGEEIQVYEVFTHIDESNKKELIISSKDY